MPAQAGIQTSIQTSIAAGIEVSWIPYRGNNGIRKTVVVKYATIIENGRT
jgi:hypothetical protein